MTVLLHLAINLLNANLCLEIILAASVRRNMKEMVWNAKEKVFVIKLALLSRGEKMETHTLLSSFKAFPRPSR